MAKKIDPNDPAGSSRSPGYSEPSAARKAKVHLREARDELRALASRQAGGVKAKAGKTANDKKQVAAGKVHAVARALREAGDALDRDGERELARWGRDAADQVERVAGYLDRQDLSGLAHDLDTRARNNPGAFVAGTFAAGIALGRFLRSSHPEPEQRETYGEEPGEVVGPSAPVRSPTARDLTSPEPWEEEFHG